MLIRKKQTYPGELPASGSGIVPGGILARGLEVAVAVFGQRSLLSFLAIVAPFFPGPAFSESPSSVKSLNTGSRSLLAACTWNRQEYSGRTPALFRSSFLLRCP